MEKNRPISPHLQIYAPQITSVLSITHRFTGVTLYFSAILFSAFVISASFGETTFDLVQSLVGTWFGKTVLFCITLAVYYHLSNGIRHLFWDFGKGFDLNTVRLSGYAVLALALFLTAITWVLALSMVVK